MSSCSFSCPAYGLDRDRLPDPHGGLLGDCASLLDSRPRLLGSATRALESGRWHPLDTRLSELEEIFATATAWWPLRGGHGCLHLVPDLLQRSGPAPRLIGYSDLTVLHACWWRRRWGESYHAFMPCVPHGDRARRSLQALWRGQAQEWSSATVPAVAVLQPGEASGPCFAGCLRVLAGLVGTPAMPDLAGTILCLEDVDERAYSIDRCLGQLALAGHLDQLAAIVWGRFPIDPPSTNSGPEVREVLEDWSRRLGRPAIAGLPFGHDADPLSLAIGRQTRLEGGADRWRLVQDAVLP